MVVEKLQSLVLVATWENCTAITKVHCQQVCHDMACHTMVVNRVQRGPTGRCGEKRPRRRPRDEVDDEVQPGTATQCGWSCAVVVAMETRGGVRPAKDAATRRVEVGQTDVVAYSIQVPSRKQEHTTPISIWRVCPCFEHVEGGPPRQVRLSVVFLDVAYDKPSVDLAPDTEQRRPASHMCWDIGAASS